MVVWKKIKLKKIKPTVVVKANVARVLYFCVCGGETFIQGYKGEGELCFDVVCRNCGAREPLARFYEPVNMKYVRQFMNDCPTQVEWKR